MVGTTNGNVMSAGARKHQAWAEHMYADGIVQSIIVGFVVVINFSD